MPDDRDPFRYCVHCGADCEADEPEHASDCPRETGIWPVRAEDQILCPHCGKDIHGPSGCAECSTPLEVGDHYVLRDAESGELWTTPPEGGIGEPICVGCAARLGLAV